MNASPIRSVMLAGKLVRSVAARLFMFCIKIDVQGRF
jgi:hypothetical protein